MKIKDFTAPILDHCSFKGKSGKRNCKGKPEVFFIRISGFHPMTMEYSGFGCLCRKHKVDITGRDGGVIEIYQGIQEGG